MSKVQGSDNVLYLVRGLCHTSECVYQNSSNNPLKICTFHQYQNFTLKKNHKQVLSSS